MTAPTAPKKLLSLIVPSYEKHHHSFAGLIKSIAAFCQDLSVLELVLVIEQKNDPLFSQTLAAFPAVASQIVHTETVLERFGCDETPAAFLYRIGKFTFQSTKKLGGMVHASADWLLVLDSESEFVKPFSAAEILANYRENPYVFFSYTSTRGEGWEHSLGDKVTRHCAKAIGSTTLDRWFLEYYAWFYQKEKIEKLLADGINAHFLECFSDKQIRQRHFFENVLYCLYLFENHADEIAFIDILQVLQSLLPPYLVARMHAALTSHFLHIGIFEYILKILRPGDVLALTPVFERYKLPFMRFEPPVFDQRYVPALKKLPYFSAVTSSHRFVWARKKIAICISGSFRAAEHSVGNIKKFLSGVNCDIFIHGWASGDDALILESLQPRASCFEVQPDFSPLLESICYLEPNTNPGRDPGVLAMFSSMEKSFALLRPYRDEYDFVMRLRPDIYFEISLMEMLRNLSEHGDMLERAVYFPAIYHSQGMNDQVAFGSIAAMQDYFATFSYIKQNIARLYFNPEAMLLSHLLEKHLTIALMNLPYALLRAHPSDVDHLLQAKIEQQSQWWAKKADLPFYIDVTAFFQDKWKVVHQVMLTEERRRKPEDSRQSTVDRSDGKGEAMQVAPAA